MNSVGPQSSPAAAFSPQLHPITHSADFKRGLPERTDREKKGKMHKIGSFCVRSSSAVWRLCHKAESGVVTLGPFCTGYYGPSNHTGEWRDVLDCDIERHFFTGPTNHPFPCPGCLRYLPLIDFAQIFSCIYVSKVFRFFLNKKKNSAISYFDNSLILSAQITRLQSDKLLFDWVLSISRGNAGGLFHHYVGCQMD